MGGESASQKRRREAQEAAAAKAKLIEDLQAGAVVVTPEFLDEAEVEVLLAFLKGAEFRGVVTEDDKALINGSLEAITSDEVAHAYLRSVAHAVNHGVAVAGYQVPDKDEAELPPATEPNDLDTPAGQQEHYVASGEVPGQPESGDDQEAIDLDSSPMVDVLVWIAKHLDQVSDEDQEFLDEPGNENWLVANRVAIAKAIQAGEPIPRPDPAPPVTDDKEDPDFDGGTPEPYLDLSYDELKALIQDEGGARAVDEIDQRTAFLSSDDTMPYLRAYALAVVEDREPKPLDPALASKAEAAAEQLARDRRAAIGDDAPTATGDPAPPPAPALGDEEVDGLRVGTPVRVGNVDRESAYNGHVGFVQEFMLRDGRDAEFLVRFHQDGQDPGERPPAQFERDQLTVVAT